MEDKGVNNEKDYRDEGINFDKENVKIFLKVVLITISVVVASVILMKINF